MIAVLLAALSGLVWGTGDFAGGKASQRAPALDTVVLSKAASLPLLALYLALVPGTLRSATFGWGLVAGVCGVLGMIIFYRALAGGAMAIVAPVSAVTSALVPLVIGLLTERLPGPLALVGAVCAIVAIALVSLAPGSTEPARRAQAALRPSPAAPEPRAQGALGLSPAAPEQGAVGLSAAAPEQRGQRALGLSLAAPDRRAQHPGGPSSLSGRLVVMALASGSGFGLFFVFLNRAGDASGGHAGLWPVLGAHTAALILGGALMVRSRARATVTVAGWRRSGPGGGTRKGEQDPGLRAAPASAELAAGGALLARPEAAVEQRQPLLPRGATLAWTIGAGVLDMTANVLYLVAVQRGLLSVVAPIASLYPVTTVLLAMAVDRERMRPIQLAGLGLAATALVLVAS